MNLINKEEELIIDITDPFETQNMESSLTAIEKSFLHDTLEHMKGCKGRNCILARKNHLQIGQDTDDTGNNINSIPFRGSRRRHGKLLKIHRNTPKNFIFTFPGNSHLIENDQVLPEGSSKKRQNK